MTHILKIIKNRTTEITLLSANLKKEGDRGIDQAQFNTKKTESISVNDRIELMFDIISLEGLVGFYGFQGGIKDESTKQNHGTATNITYQREADFYGDEAIFNGTNSFASVSDDDDLDLSGQFDIIMWVKWLSTTEQFLLSKRSSTSNGFALSVNASTAGDVKFSIGSDTLTSSSSSFNNGDKHLIRIKRDSNNLITLYVDDTSVGTVTSSYNPTNTESMLIGKDYGGSFFNGYMLRLRIYKGYNKIDSNITKLYGEINPRTLLKFGGFVTKIDIELAIKKVTAQSYGKILAETDVRGENYDGKTVEYIVNDLITSNTSFTFSDRNSPSGLIISKFVADGKIIDIIRDFANFTNRVFYTTANEEFFFEPVSYNYVSSVFTHGTSGAIIEKSALDDTQLVNSITLLGEVLEYKLVETFNGNNSNKNFVLINTAIMIEVQLGGVVQEPDVDYETDSLNKEIIFTTAPPTGTNNISVEYYYEIPITVKGTKQSSIDTYGIHSKKFNLDWISNRTDGVRFIQSYLNRYGTVKQNISMRFGQPILYLNENDVLNVVNDFLDISGNFAVKSIEWSYPDLNTEVIVGEYRFDYFEDDKEIVRKLHDYESSITKSKEIQDYESPEEILTLTDIVIQYIINIYTETLNISNTTVIYDKTNNNYGSGTYGSRVTGSVYVSE